MTRFITTMALALSFSLAASVGRAQDEDTPPPAAEETPPIAQTQPDEPPLPEGHPQISEMGDVLDADGNPAVAGSLAIQVVQGTEGGPDPANLHVEINLYFNGQLMRTVERETDAYGIALIENFPVLTGMVPVVTVHVSDVTYSEQGEPLTPEEPNRVMEVMIYDVRAEEPAWEVTNRAIIAHRQEDGVLISEMYQVNNPANYTWRGHPDGEGRGNAFSVTLPKNAGRIQLEKGYHDWCCTEMIGSTLVNKNPLVPGMTEYVFAYFIPAARGKTEFTITSPALTKETIVYLPADDEGIEVDGLSEPKFLDLGDIQVDTYTASNLPANTRTRIVLTGFSTNETLDAAMTQASYAKFAVRVGLGFLVFVMGAIVIAAFVMKKSEPAGGEGA